MADQYSTLKKTALAVREIILKMSTDGGCFTGASLSCTDLLVFLYSKYLNISKDNLESLERDYFFLSKGHDVPALYGTLVALGLMDEQRLKNHLSVNDHIYWHPNQEIPFVEFHSGSLGHLPSVAIGVALDCKMRETQNRIIVMVGDGELNEGSVWEALLVANANKLSNLTILVDRNNFQANVATESLIPLEPLADKFLAFGCAVKVINGHNFQEINQVFSGLPFTNNCVNVIIANTIRGKGVPSIEARADRWFCNFNYQEVEALIKELHGNGIADIISETLLVR